MFSFGASIWQLKDLVLFSHFSFYFFSEFIEKLFDDSQEQFHGIFKKTYGPLYEKNARIFRDYFEALRKYFYHGRVNLNEATKSFFATLYQKMFQVCK